MPRPMLARCARAALPCLVLLAAARAEDPEPGVLPAGHESQYEVRDVVTEACRQHVFPPEVFADAMPAGYRLTRLAERSTVKWVAALLKDHPERADWASGAFCFIEAGMHTVDGENVYDGRPARIAFLWADMAPVGEPAKDERFRGDMRHVQLFWMYHSEGVNRERALRAVPNALFGTIGMERAGEGWKLAIETEDGRLSAELTPTTPRVKLDYTVGYETLPLTGSARDHFMVISFSGHHDRRAAGSWQAEGSAAWARSFAGGTIDGGSFIQDGWAARSGLYRWEGPKH